MKTDYEDINRRQAAYYESRFESSKSGQSEKAAGHVTNIWTFLRRRVQAFYADTSLAENYDELQLRWMREARQGDVIDLGCFNGNSLSMALAEESKSYLAIDLSESAIAELNEKLDKAKFKHAKGIAADICALNLPDASADLIYARSVLHHFPDPSRIINEMDRVLKPGGIVVSFDPLGTALANRLARACYRPFQSDADWEWPFSKETLNSFEAQFDLVKIRGFRGASKFAMPMYVLGLKSISKKMAVAGDRLDATHGAKNNWYLRNVCWNVMLCLRKKEF